jgi:hypothetical protein
VCGGGGEKVTKTERQSKKNEIEKGRNKERNIQCNKVTKEERESGEMMRETEK